MLLVEEVAGAAGAAVAENLLLSARSFLMLSARLQSGALLSGYGGLH